MMIRSFSRSFQAVVEETDCDCDEKTSALAIANSQPGRWNVWNYSPPSNDSMLAHDDEGNDPSSETAMNNRRKSPVELANENFQLIAGPSLI